MIAAPADVGYNESLCVALLGLAESFRVSNPPRIRLCIQCIQALFVYPLPAHVLGLAHFHLGRVYYQYTKNMDVARLNLEHAYQIVHQMQGFEEIRVQIASLLAEIYKEQKHTDQCKNILKTNLNLSRSYSFWHCRLLFQLTELNSALGDNAAALQTLEDGCGYCEQSRVPHTEILFRLSSAMLLLLDRQRAHDARAILERVGHLINNVPGSSARREQLNAFFLILQLCYLLSAGQIKTAKPCLKLLQVSAQKLTSAAENDHQSPPLPGEQFEWLPKEHITILVYLVTVVHSMQAGQLDRVRKYAEKALTQLDKLNGAGVSKPHSHPQLLTTFQALLYENSTMGRLVVGQPSNAIQEIYTMCQLLSEEQPSLFANHEAQAHTLLGMYAISIRRTDVAERQFLSALKMTRDLDLWSVINLNLAILYLQTSREQDFYTLLETITPERLPSTSQSLLAASHYVRGLQSFYQSRYQEAKRYLKDCLSISNEEDIMRISAAALVLLGHIFLRYQNVQECSNMLKPSLELAKNIQDLSLQTWTTSLLQDVYSLCGDKGRAGDSRQLVDAYVNKMDADAQKAIAMPENAILDWTEGPFPFSASHNS